MPPLEKPYAYIDCCLTAASASNNTFSLFYRQGRFGILSFILNRNEYVVFLVRLRTISFHILFPDISDFLFYIKQYLSTFYDDVTFTSKIAS